MTTVTVPRALHPKDGPTIVVGHSYGGQIMTALGTDAPTRVTRSPDHRSRDRSAGRSRETQSGKGSEVVCSAVAASP